MNTGSGLYLLLLFGLVGGAMLTVPLFSRRPILFGVHVGEENARGRAARRIVLGFSATLLAVLGVGCAACAALFSAGSRAPLWIAPLLLVAGFFGAYFVAHGRARRMAVAPSGRAPSGSEPGAGTPEATSPGLLPLFTLVIGLVAAGFGLAYAVVHYPEMPDLIPVHFGADGVPDRFAERSLATVFLMPALNAALFTLLGFLCLGLARTRRLPGDGHGRRLRRVVVVYVSLASWMVIGLLTSIVLGGIDTALGEAAGLSRAVGTFGIGLGLVVLGGLGPILWFGLRRSRARGALPDRDWADDRHWRLGLFYSNPDDPSLFVEQRFGLGYTLNLANRGALALVLGFLVIVLGSVAAAVLF